MGIIPIESCLDEFKGGACQLKRGSSNIYRFAYSSRAIGSFDVQYLSPYRYKSTEIRELTYHINNDIVVLR